ncbi:MAG: hypothetical protein LBV43_04915 [Prevotella sp.]|jgi:hypothetical protein|nr:hypothetical protein [Prevotella sp.]
MIYKLIKTIDSQMKGEDCKIITLEVDDLIPFNQQTDEFKDLFKSISQNNIAEFDNAIIVLFPESGRVIISNK